MRSFDTQTDNLMFFIARKIEELTDLITWKLAGTVTGTSSSVAIPSTAKEIFVRLSYVNSGGSDQLRFTWTMPVEDLSESIRTYNSGYNGGTSVTAFAQVVLSRTSAKINNMTVSGTSYAANARLAVWYR